MHRGPDGDAIGSSLGWHHLLKKQGIESTVIAPDAYPDFLKWMPGNENVIIYEKNRDKAVEVLKEADLVFCLDFNAPDRMGNLKDAVMEAGKPMVVVDHHRQPADFAQVYYVDDTASSAAEMIYRLNKALGWKKDIDRNAAICLYTGIVTDTGSFRFSSVSPKLMRIASRLMETGIDHTEVYRHVFDSQTVSRLKLQGFAISEKLEVMEEAATAFMSLTQVELQRFHYQKGDTEGLVNQALSIQGINLAAFFSEKDGIIKISFRSRGNFDVNVFARNNFEGGGHSMAAGGKSELSMEETLKKFRKLVSEEAKSIKESV